MKLIVSISILYQILSVEGILMLDPYGSVIEFINADIYFTCRSTDTDTQIVAFQWWVNGTVYTENPIEFIAEEGVLHNIGELLIRGIYAMYNNTEFQCRGISNDDVELISETTLIILQGRPLPVGNLEANLVDDMTINVTWTAPYLLRNEIFYIVHIENRTSFSTSREMTYQTYFLIYSESSRPISCDDFIFTIIPRNGAGEGQERLVYQISGAPEIVTSILILNNDTKYDLFLSLTSPICRITNLLVRNVNLNDIHLQGSFMSFSLVNESMNIYNYLIKFDLKKRFLYDIDFEIEISSHRTQFSQLISTHEVKNITVHTFSKNSLSIEAYKSDDSTSGVFVAMLFCQTESCDAINFNNSFFILKHNKNDSIFHVNFVNGNYLRYAYDIDYDGEVLPSEDATNISYSIESKQISLNYMGASEKYIPSKGYNCDLRFNNISLGSVCNRTYNISDLAKQQLILQSVDSWNILYVSNSIALCEPICLERVNEDFCALTLLIENTSTLQSSQPIGRTNIFSDHLENINFNEEVCPSTNSNICDYPQPATSEAIPHTNETTDPDKPNLSDADIAGIAVVVVFALIAAVVIFTLIGLLMCRKKKVCAKIKRKKP